MHDLLDAPPAAAQRGGAAVAVAGVADRDAPDRPDAAGTPKAARKVASRSGGMPKKQAPRPSSTAVSSISSEAIPASTSQ